jgi:hypothetical protein
MKWYHFALLFLALFFAILFLVGTFYFQAQVQELKLAQDYKALLIERRGAVIDRLAFQTQSLVETHRTDQTELSEDQLPPLTKESVNTSIETYNKKAIQFNKNPTPGKEPLELVESIP